MSWVYSLEYQRLKQLERSLPSWARAVTLVSEGEADHYREFAGAAKVVTVTNGVDLDFFHPQPVEGTNLANTQTNPTFVFVGAFDYFPNIDGATWFCEEIWPAVRCRLPTATLQLVGRRPDPKVMALGDLPGVEVVGSVPDVRPYLYQATSAVIPLRIARGLQNKVLEAMSVGKPVVSTSRALAGFNQKMNLPALEAETCEEWVTHLATLANDLDQQKELGAAGRRYAQEYHNWAKCLEPFARLLGV